MTTYSVSVTIGTLTTEVEAVDVDAALAAATDEWYMNADDIIDAGTYSVRELLSQDAYNASIIAP